MRIVDVRSWEAAVPLTRPYDIASLRIDAVDLCFVRIVADNGLVGVGSASPGEDVTGESPDACRLALGESALEWLQGRDPRHLGALCQELERSHRPTPAARAAVEMALHDLFARIVGVPLVEILGRRLEALPTSVTIGIGSVEETLAEAEEYLGGGFRCLKVKIGESFDQDLERLRKLRERLGNAVRIRIDANQGYSLENTRLLGTVAAELSLELVEQPLPAAAISEMKSLPPSLRRILAADESLRDEADALALAGPPPLYGIYNIKLMKCGGVRPALTIAALARVAGIDLMWGCNDESVVSIAAALHAAYACPHTRYIDLDGSFDLARDPGRGGFVVDNGCLRLLDRPGLGVEVEE